MIIHADARPVGPAGCHTPCGDHSSPDRDPVVIEPEPGGRRRLGWILLILLHAPLGVALAASSALATAHALGVFLLGLWFAARKRIDQVAYLAAYIAGAEVLWRMCEARVFWEYGKYSASFLLLAALVRVRAYRPPILPVLYFALQVPSIALIVVDADPGTVRNSLSFYLSGPFSLMVASWFYARLGITRPELVRLFLTLLAPVAGIASVAFYSIATASSLEFNTESNFATSGGFGPNQVSSVLGLGALIAFLCVLVGPRARGFRFLALAGSLYLAAQSALTFSRSGLYCAGAGVAVAALCMSRSPAMFLRLAVGLSILAGVSVLFVIPFFESFTGGALTERFRDTGMTGRDTLMFRDVETWMENPILGVGPGRSVAAHQLAGHSQAASHSEATRMLAEHGLLGLGALMLLGGMGLLNYLRGRDTAARSVVASLACWSLVLIISNGMRLFAPSLIYGLTFAVLVPEGDGRRA